MSIRELIARVGQGGLTGSLSVEKSLRVNVRIVDAREAYGRTDYLVEPIAGAGQQWVSAERVSLDSDDSEAREIAARVSYRRLTANS